MNEKILFSDSIPVLDVAVLQVRKMVRDEGYDPLELPVVERSNSMGVQVGKGHNASCMDQQEKAQMAQKYPIGNLQRTSMLSRLMYNKQYETLHTD